MKWKRSERLIDITLHLLEHPQKVIPLTVFSEKYDVARSSVSEDIRIVKNIFEQRGTGNLVTVPGSTGGVKYIPKMSNAEVQDVMAELIDKLREENRLLPGGYLFMADLLGDSHLIDRVGRVFASKFANEQIDVVMTVETKGIQIAHSIARYLNVPVVIVRRDSKVTEGSTVSINYVSGSTRRIEQMVLSKRIMESGQKVLLTDDFMKAGGTMRGMTSLLEEFNCELAGIAVLVEAEHHEEILVEDYISLIKLCKVNEKSRTIELSEGNYFKKGGRFE